MAQLATDGPLSNCVNAEPWISYNGGIMKGSTCNVAYAASPMREDSVRMQRSENVAAAETADELRAAAPGNLD